MMWDCHFLYFISIFSFYLLYYLGSTLCPGRCDCNDEKLMVMCKGAHLDVVPITLNPELKELYLGNNQIKSIMSSFSVYRNLEFLDISQNSIVSLGRKNFAMQKKLRVLLAGKNFISEINNQTFHGLSSLQLLHLNDNFVKKLGPRVFVGLNKLEKVDLSGNDISSITEETFSGLTSLKTLLLRDNKLTLIPTQSFAHLPNLVKLDLGINSLTEIPEYAFSTLSSLQDLSLDGCLISSIQINAFEYLDQLKSLKIQDNNLGQIPTEAIETLSNVEELIISKNKVKKLESFSFRGMSRLKTFVMSHTDQLQVIDTDVFYDNPHLEKVIIEFNKNLKILHPGMFDVQASSLKYLSLRGNQISNLHSRLLPNWERLEYFDMRGNPLDCNCSILWLLNYIKHTNSTTKQYFHDVFCYSPPNLNQLPLISLSSSQLGCYQTNSSQIITTTVIIASICAICFILVTIICRTKICTTKFTFFINKNKYDSPFFPSLTDDLSYEKGRIIDNQVTCHTPANTIMIHPPIKIAPIYEV